MDDLLADFVAETREMLEASEGEIIAWEADPTDTSRVDTIFRFVHTVKGNCGFFDFPRLAGLSHAAEDALADCRAGRRDPDASLVSAVLAIIDRISLMVDAIETGQPFAEEGDEALIAALGNDTQTGMDTVDAAPTAAQPPAHAPANSILGSYDNSDEAEQALKPDAALPVQRSIRLPVDLLDRVMSGVSDMVLARNDLGHRLRQAGTQPTINGPFERLTTILSDVRDAITRMRMQRIETVFAALPRLVRDLSAELGKQVMIDLEGGDVELDREMVEMVRDPLTHIIRNAIDHGMETPSDRLRKGKREIGLLSIAARQSGNTISIVVNDDGRGLDEEKIAAKAVSTKLVTSAQLANMSRESILQLIFEPGFSTADEVSNVSGRGVGLDVVRDNLQKVGGSIKVSSQPDVGTLFTLQIPLTLSIIAGLTVEVKDQRFAIPQSYIEEIIHSSAKALDFNRVGETALVTFRGQRVACLMLSEVLGLDTDDIAEGEHTMVLLRLASGDLFAIAVDNIHTHGDLVVKPLAPAVMRSGYYAGSTLLDDGQPILLLDVTNIASEYGLVSDARTRVLQTPENAAAEADKDIQRAMLFTDFDNRRCAVRLELVKRIETAPASAIDLSGAKPRAVIDHMILPVIGLPNGQIPLEKIRLLRLSDGDCELLYAVREIDDAVELTAALRPAQDDPLIEAITLVDEKTVSLIDGHELFSRFGEPPEVTAKPLCRLPGSEWARTILGPLVTSAGYEIADNASVPRDDGSEVCIMLEEEYEAAEALEMPLAGPVIRLRNLPQATPGTETIYRYDRDALVNALQTARIQGGKR
ncbi:chemotaxis protein CheA [Erythrobacter insulae]|uniref:Chemotaxis protein CheA n=1 Tax=Erythrobacter insulae TaxID=2584124 RepID=A0A547P9U3_9SPHN|nr:chemotaxis protein CheA [Erythrobacter insulae]TRD10867.1 chemotaxis protein CheA [Erythrobacter insulae]